MTFRAIRIAAGRSLRIGGRCALVVAVAMSATACIHAPDVVIVDRRTALEAEAAGRFEDLEERLDQEAIDPRPLPLTRARLEAAGWRPKAESDAIAQMTRRPSADQDRVDDLLRRACVGEALDGSLVATPATCAGARDAAEIGRLLERGNRARRQIWAWMRRKAPAANEPQTRQAWRKYHLVRVVCGGQIEVSEKRWQPKVCE